MGRGCCLYRFRTSGSLAMFAAIRRASSRVSRFISPAAAGLVLEIDVVSAWPLASAMTNDSGFSTIDQGGGKRRGDCTRAISAAVPSCA
jgi:hypothetical protein